jgi:hypothetical protein
MTKRLVAAAAAVCVRALYPAEPRAQKDNEEARRVHDATTVFGEIMSAEDKAIPNQRFYGKRLTTSQIVFGGQAGAPGEVGLWRSARDRYAR